MNQDFAIQACELEEEFKEIGSAQEAAENDHRDQIRLLKYAR